ncbi:glucose-1-phosphate adenylyltransferase [Abyssalbus ytuae]|uniref:Glucose-1-phosphate adenylyltransferase n=1 Tax=Abyssalbus ytuae TaxID=2926907 RepID=A0A9E6ZNZ2_9FLAO|nr:glucose-1-phosphate adenylyltransferase [Abyssalbus ytuae]UOB19382.1 glucose-1-phosphate adenylyltransferase [Abyssalbus ytuae]
MLNKKVLSIILGGGQGTRLFPLTSARSKPAVPIAGKYRLVDIPISNCINCNLKRIFVLTQFNSASLNRHVKNTYQFSLFSEAFVDILAAEQTPENPTWFQGTADAVRQCMHHFNSHNYEYALILSGDQLYQMDFMDMLHAHINSGADITVATQPVKAKDASAFGILKTDEHHFIRTFTEKPPQDQLAGWDSEVSEEMEKEGRLYLASMGIYIFNRTLLEDVMFNTNDVDFGKDIIPNAITGNKKVLGYQYEGYWEDIGTISAFYEANLALTDDIPRFNLFDKSKSIYTRGRILPPTKMSGTFVERSMIAEGCIIHAKSIERSVIGIRTRIGNDTIVKNTYIMGNDRYESIEEIEKAESEGMPHLGIGNRCEIYNTIVDKDCMIGDDVTIKGGEHLADTENEMLVIRDGVVVIKKGAFIPNGTKI